MSEPVDWEALRDRADHDRKVMREEGCVPVRIHCNSCGDEWISALVRKGQRLGSYLLAGAACPRCREHDALVLCTEDAAPFKSKSLSQDEEGI